MQHREAKKALKVTQLGRGRNKVRIELPNPERAMPSRYKAAGLLGQQGLMVEASRQ